MSSRKLARRTFLRASGIALSLPMLQSMKTRAAESDSSQSEARRMIAICAPLGIHTPFLFPETTGRDYAPTAYLEPLQPVRERQTASRRSRRAQRS